MQRPKLRPNRPLAQQRERGDGGGGALIANSNIPGDDTDNTETDRASSSSSALRALLFSASEAQRKARLAVFEHSQRRCKALRVTSVRFPIALHELAVAIKTLAGSALFAGDEELRERVMQCRGQLERQRVHGQYRGAFFLSCRDAPRSCSLDALVWNVTSFIGLLCDTNNNNVHHHGRRRDTPDRGAWMSDRLANDATVHVGTIAPSRTTQPPLRDMTLGNAASAAHSMGWGAQEADWSSNSAAGNANWRCFQGLENRWAELCNSIGDAAVYGDAPTHLYEYHAETQQYRASSAALVLFASVSSECRRHRMAAGALQECLKWQQTEDPENHSVYARLGRRGEDPLFHTQTDALRRLLLLTAEQWKGDQLRERVNVIVARSACPGYLKEVCAAQYGSDVSLTASEDVLRQMLPSTSYETLVDAASRTWCPDNNLFAAPVAAVRDAAALHLMHAVLALHYDVKFVGRHVLLLGDWLRLHGRPAQPSSGAPLLCHTGAPHGWVVLTWWWWRSELLRDGEEEETGPETTKMVATPVGNDVAAAMAMWLLLLREGPAQGMVDTSDLTYMCDHLDAPPQEGKQQHQIATGGNPDSTDDYDAITAVVTTAAANNNTGWAAVSSTHATV